MFERLKQRISGIGFFNTPPATRKTGGGGPDHLPRPHFIQRSIDGNSLTDRNKNLGKFLEINSEIITALERVQSRARYLYANDPYVSNALDTWTSEAIGTGLRPSPMIEGDQRQILDAWEKWSHGCDFDQITNFEGLQSDVALALKRDGEALILLHETEEGLKLQHLDSARLDSQKTFSQYYSQNQNIVISGVEFDNKGNRVARLRSAGPFPLHHPARFRLGLRVVSVVLVPVKNQRQSFIEGLEQETPAASNEGFP